MFKKEFPKIKFYTSLEGLRNTPEVHPQPANKFIPQWWKTLPKQKPFPENQTVKVCPSFPEFFSQGYILPLWVDLMLTYNKDLDEYSWRAGMPGPFNPFEVEPHTNNQFIDLVTPSLNGKEGTFIFKLSSPWRLKTPKGYSVYQLPLYYHFNNEFSVMPGIIHTDIHTEINQQVVYYGNGEPVTIRRGTPFVQYIPFKRITYDLVVGTASEEEAKLDSAELYNVISKFPGSGAYKTKFLHRNRETDV